MHFISECSSSSCPATATCSDHWDDHVCTCNQGYIGQQAHNTFKLLNFCRVFYTNSIFLNVMFLSFEW